MLPVNLSFYEVTFQAHPPLLQGHATRPLSHADFTEVCELLLATAQYYKCAYWLLDARPFASERPLALEVWLTEDFLPRVHEALGHATLHLAFLVGPSFGQLNQPPSFASPATGLITLPYKVAWFPEEVSALEWLNQFRTR